MHKDDGAAISASPSKATHGSRAAAEGSTNIIFHIISRLLRIDYISYSNSAYTPLDFSFNI